MEETQEDDGIEIEEVRVVEKGSKKGKTAKKGKVEDEEDEGKLSAREKRLQAKLNLVSSRGRMVRQRS